MTLREMTSGDRAEVAELIYASINGWYQAHGMSPLFQGGPRVTEVFQDVYTGIGTSRGVVAENARTARLMGSCFYHPRKHHVALGIMNVHPNYFGFGVGGALLKYITDFTDREGYKALRLTQSALNLDSYSLYTRAGFVPRQAYQDMILDVPAAGMTETTPGLENVRDAKPEDVPAMAALEFDVSGVTRDEDYRYLIENALGCWHVSVHESPDGTLDGFLASSSHPALNMLGPGVMRGEEQAAALIIRELDKHRGRSPVFVVPADREKLIRQCYGWGARNCELHFGQVRGQWKPYDGINMPTFLLETA